MRKQQENGKAHKMPVPPAVVAGPIVIDSVPGLAELVDAFGDESPDLTDPTTIANHKQIFDLCQAQGAIPADLKSGDCYVEFNDMLGEIRFVNKAQVVIDGGLVS